MIADADGTMLSIAAVKHAEFVRARGRHYSNEAEAMKVYLIPVMIFMRLTSIFQRAQQMMEDEDDSEVPEDDDPMNHYPGPPALNGIKAST
jgi:protein phosphatase inhibitor 2